MPANVVRLRQRLSSEMRPLAAKGRSKNTAYRIRELLTEDEFDKLIRALKIVQPSAAAGRRVIAAGGRTRKHTLGVYPASDLKVAHRADAIHMALDMLDVRANAQHGPVRSRGPTEHKSGVFRPRRRRCWQDIA